MVISLVSTGGARKTKSEFLAAALNCNDEVVLEFCSLVNKCFLFCSVFQIFTKLFDHRIAKWVSNIFYNLLQICCLLCLFFTIKTSDLCQIFTSIACFVLKKILKIIKCLSVLKVFYPSNSPCIMWQRKASTDVVALFFCLPYFNDITWVFWGCCMPSADDWLAWAC